MINLPTVNAENLKQPLGNFSSMNSGFADLIERVGPAVVNIRILQDKSTENAGNSLFSGDDFLNDFFSHFFQNIPGRGVHNLFPEARQSPRAIGVGSGFLISSDGYIMTNAHVVSGGNEIMVKLKDVSHEIKAKVIGIDSPSDLAVIKIEKQNLPYLKFGDSDKIRVGEWVLAIGSPFNLENSVTVGILSAKYRHLNAGFDDLSQYPFLQTDAALNKGNSGGPLLNTSGEVIGVNSQILSGTGQFAGVSFALPSNLTKEIFIQLKTKGYVRRGKIGVRINNLDDSVAKEYQLPLGQGVLVSSIEENSPAAKAGIKPGDIILSFNGNIIFNTYSLRNAVNNAKPGDKSAVEILRGRKKIIVKVGVEESLQTEQSKCENYKKQELNIDGLVVESGGSAICKRNHAQSGCVVVQSVLKDSRFSKQLHQGDVILEVNRYPVNDIDTFRKKIMKSIREKLIFLISNHGEVKFVSIPSI